MRRLNNLHPITFLFVKIFIWSVFILNKISKHKQKLNHWKILQVYLYELFYELHELRMLYLKKFSHLCAFNYVRSLEFLLFFTEKVQITIKKSTVQKVVLLLSIVNFKIDIVFKYKSLDVGEDHSERVNWWNEFLSIVLLLGKFLV